MTGQGQAGLARRLERLTGASVHDLRLTGSQHRWRHYRAVLAGGRRVFVKAADADLGGVFGAEAHGLGWLGETGTVGVPEVAGWDGATLVVSWVPGEAPDQRAAQRFGRDLARMHRAGAADFGAPWPGFIASLPLPNDGAPGPRDGSGERAGDRRDPAAPLERDCQPGRASADPAPAVAGGWPPWYAARRVLPYLRVAADAGTLSRADVTQLETVLARIGELAGPPEPPSRVHGDCWSGNVLWSGGRGWLIDPAAHGGHRETDLAMLALFGAPFLDRILACYQEVAPLADGWRQRVPLHQLHPLLVHVCLFGASYRQPLLAAVRAALAA